MSRADRLPAAVTQANVQSYVVQEVCADYCEDEYYCLLGVVSTLRISR